MLDGGTDREGCRVAGQAYKRFKGGVTGREEVAGWRDIKARGCRVSKQADKDAEWWDRKRRGCRVTGQVEKVSGWRDRKRWLQGVVTRREEVARWQDR